ncbi:MAG TPA: hypothetical protein VJ728_17675 [Candidatus Binataceae bacterium]|nr:hypothetical protein [Candidatus Binataceae bacterium]
MAEPGTAYPPTGSRYTEEMVIHRPGVLRPISWGALFGGVMVSLAFQLLLTILAIGIGLSFVRPATANPNEAGLGAGIWWGIVYLVSLIIGGYFAARLSGMAGIGDGIMHGILTWAFGLLVTFYLLTTAIGSILGGVLGVVGKSISAAGTALKPVVSEVANTSGISSGDLNAQVDKLLNTNGTKLNPQQARDQLATDLKNYLAGGSNAGQARADIVNIMSSQLNISQAQASQRLDQWQAQFNQTKNNVAQTAKNTGLQAAHAVSWAAIGSFIALALGIICGAIGGALGVRRHVAEATR